MDGKMHGTGDREPAVGDHVVWSSGDKPHSSAMNKRYGEGPHVIADVRDVEHANGGRMKFELQLRGIAGWFDEELLAFV